MRQGKITAVTSLPDHAFTKAGAQNKTSILFFQKYTEAEKRSFDTSLDDVLEDRDIDDMDDLTGAEKWDVMTDVVADNDYQTFLAEAEEIGYAPTGQSIEQNDLYTLGEDGLPVSDEGDTILS